MSRPEGLRVDQACGRIDWNEAGAAKHASVEGAVDARYDAWTERLIVLTRTSERSGVSILSRDGEIVGAVPAPEGYSLSHFAGGSEPVLVGQGESPYEGWQDWHFEVDEEGRRLRRLGPGY